MPALSEEKRELGAHQHGHGALNIAVEGGALVLELEVPGFDIVGFEHPAETEADKAAIEAGLAALSDANALFGLPAAAGCEVSNEVAELHGDEDHHDDHDDHDHDEHAEHNHDDHEEKKDGHDHDHDDHKDDHAEHDDHDDHKEDHAEHDHDDHGDAHADGESHSEFHAEYTFACADASKLSQIELTYFNVFENAEELEVQIVTDAGSKKVEATRESATIDLN